MQQFYHISTGGFILQPLESFKFDTGHFPTTPAATPCTFRNQREEHIQTKRKQDMQFKTDLTGLSVLENGKCQLASTLAPS